MKIICIEPRSPGIHIFTKWASIPRLGLPILGTMLAEVGHEVKIFVEEIAKINWEEVFSADLVLISTITSTAPKTYDLAKRISEKGIPVVLGGPHPTELPEEALEYADFVVRGEGEEAILPLVRAIETGKGLENIRGLSYRLFGRIFHNPMPESRCDINKYPAPNFLLIEKWKGNKIVPIQTSRGCPFNCEFCSVTKIFGRRMRYKTTERIVEEIKSQDCKHIFFCDDNFTADREKTKALLRGIIREGIHISWGTQVRVDAAQDEELVALMKKTGCFMVYVGIESVNPESLKAARKGQTIDDIVAGIRVFRRYGIKIHGMFVIGFDTDDIKTIQRIVKFAKKEEIDSIQIMILTPLPGTVTREELEKEGRLLPEIGWDKYDGHHVVFRSNIIPDRLQIEAMKAMAKFYSWRMIVKEFLKGNWWGTMVGVYGHRLVKEWKRSVRESFLKKLRSLSNKLGVKD